MYQGSIGKLKNRKTGHEDWYQKLRCIDDVYFVNIDIPSIKIRANHVDESSRTTLERDYCVIAEIVGEDVIRCGNYKVDESMIIASQQIQLAQRSLQNLKKQKDSNNYYLRTYETYKIQDIALENRITELEKTINSLSKGKPIEYTYVYGKHTADSKEYCWTLPLGLSVSVGDTIDVDTAIGKQKAIVIRIEKSFENRDHKSVIQVY